jgi:hypothetical protein
LRPAGGSQLPSLGLHAGPRLDQRPVNREVVVRQQRFDLLLVQDRSHELAGNVALKLLRKRMEREGF